MKTGMVRTIDDMGRIVIPREIRKSLHIEMGDPIEIGVVDDTICLTKYTPNRGYELEIKRLRDSIAESDGLKEDVKNSVMALLETAANRLGE